MNVDTAVTTISVLLEVMVILTMLRGTQFKRLPVFFAYIVWALISDVGMLWTGAHRPDIYKSAYITESSIDAALQYCVIVELVWSVLKPLRKALPKGSLAVLSLLIGLAGLAIWPLANAMMPATMSNVDQTIFHLVQTFAILRVLLFLVMASFSQVLSIGWRDRELQVATGFGFYAIVSLIVSVVHTHQQIGPEYHWLDLIVAVSYLCTLSYWVLSFVTKEQKKLEISQQMTQILVTIGGSLHADRLALENLREKGERGRKR